MCMESVIDSISFVLLSRCLDIIYLFHKLLSYEQNFI